MLAGTMTLHRKLIFCLDAFPMLWRHGEMFLIIPVKRTMSMPCLALWLLLCSFFFFSFSKLIFSVLFWCWYLTYKKTTYPLPQPFSKVLIFLSSMTWCTISSQKKIVFFFQQNKGKKIKRKDHGSSSYVSTKFEIFIVHSCKRVVKRYKAIP